MSLAVLLQCHNGTNFRGHLRSKYLDICPVLTLASSASSERVEVMRSCARQEVRTVIAFISLYASA